MPRSYADYPADIDAAKPVGVGLRHAHFREALHGAAALDFLEVHTENFFAEGGRDIVFLEKIAERYPLSFHGTSLGLGSVSEIAPEYLRRLKRVVETFKPVLLSDHASFSWGRLHNKTVHAGDLLPLPFNTQSLMVLANNVDRVQQMLGRKLLVENIVIYLEIPQNSMNEAEFFTRLVERTGCGLLLDLNNLLVNAINQGEARPLHTAKNWLLQIPPEAVAEIHLAGYTPAREGDLIVDDHSQPVSATCWELYECALRRFPRVATLIEWDNNLPSWSVLTQQADKARQKILSGTFDTTMAAEQ